MRVRSGRTVLEHSESHGEPGGYYVQTITLRTQLIQPGLRDSQSGILGAT